MADLYSGNFEVSLYEMGMVGIDVANVERNTFGSKMPDLACVCIKWVMRFICNINWQEALVFIYEEELMSIVGWIGGAEVVVGMLLRDTFWERFKRVSKWVVSMQE